MYYEIKLQRDSDNTYLNSEDTLDIKKNEEFEDTLNLIIENPSMDIELSISKLYKALLAVGKSKELIVHITDFVFVFSRSLNNQKLVYICNKSPCREIAVPYNALLVAVQDLNEMD